MAKNFFSKLLNRITLFLFFLLSPAFLWLVAKILFGEVLESQVDRLNLIWAFLWNIGKNSILTYSLISYFFSFLFLYAALYTIFLLCSPRILKEKILDDKRKELIFSVTPILKVLLLALLIIFGVITLILPNRISNHQDELIGLEATTDYQISQKLEENINLLSTIEAQRTEISNFQVTSTPTENIENQHMAFVIDFEKDLNNYLMHQIQESELHNTYAKDINVWNAIRFDFIDIHIFQHLKSSLPISLECFNLEGTQPTIEMISPIEYKIIKSDRCYVSENYTLKIIWKLTREYKVKQDNSSMRDFLISEYSYEFISKENK